MSTPLSIRIGSVITAEFLTLLDELCPLRLPDPTILTAEMWMKAGERRLVETLRSKYAEANDPN